MASLNEWDAALHWVYQSLLFIWKIKNPNIPKNRQTVINRASTWITYSLVISKKAVQASVEGEERFLPKHGLTLSSMLSKGKKKIEVLSCTFPAAASPCLPSEMVAKLGAQMQD